MPHQKFFPAHMCGIFSWRSFTIERAQFLCSSLDAKCDNVNFRKWHWKQAKLTKRKVLKEQSKLIISMITITFTRIQIQVTALPRTHTRLYFILNFPLFYDHQSYIRDFFCLFVTTKPYDMKRKVLKEQSKLIISMIMIKFTRIQIQVTALPRTHTRLYFILNFPLFYDHHLISEIFFVYL